MFSFVVKLMIIEKREEFAAQVLEMSGDRESISEGEVQRHGQSSKENISDELTLSRCPTLMRETQESIECQVPLLFVLAHRQSRISAVRFIV